MGRRVWTRLVYSATRWRTRSGDEGVRASLGGLEGRTGYHVKEPTLQGWVVGSLPRRDNNASLVVDKRRALVEWKHVLETALAARASEGVFPGCGCILPKQ